MISLFQSRVYLAVTLGHFTIDIFNSAGPVLVTFLSLPMALTTAQIGMAIGGYQFFSALSQPFFGWLADKVGSRWLGPGSVAWTIGFLILSVWIAQQTGSFWLFMVPFVLASMGSSAFHPLGAKHAADEAALRAATGTAIFFLFGQTGLAAGPFLTGIILGRVGITGLYVLATLTIPVIIYMAVAMRHTYPLMLETAIDSEQVAQAAKEAVRWGAIALLATVIGLRSWAAVGTVSFLPKMFQEMGWSPAWYGSLTGTFWLSSGILGVLAGSWADRWGRRQVVSITLLIGAVSLYFLPLYDNWIAFPLAILTGGFLGASHSILVVISQSVLPGKKAFTSGVTLGYLFGTGAIAAWGIGYLADIWGLTIVIQAGSAVTIVAALLAMALPATRETVQVQPEGIPAR